MIEELKTIKAEEIGGTNSAANEKEHEEGDPKDAEVEG